MCAEIGIDIDAAAQNTVADVLWAQGEASTSIRLLRQIVESPRPKKESEEVHRSSLLAKLVCFYSGCPFTDSNKHRVTTSQKHAWNNLIRS